MSFEKSICDDGDPDQTNRNLPMRSSEKVGTTPLADVEEDKNLVSGGKNSQPKLEGVLAAETDRQSSLLPAAEMIDRELVALALESHARALMYPNSRIQHDRANECAMELLRRLNTRYSDASKEYVRGLNERKDSDTD